MTNITTYECTPRQIRKFTERILTKGLVPFIQGSPGIGKSAIVKDIAREYNLEVIDHRLSTSAPEDLTGLPKFTKKHYKTIDHETNEKIDVEYEISQFIPFETFPVEYTPLPKGKNGWLLFLDEFNSAKKEIQAAAYKLILDKQVGLHNLHSKCFIVCAGNLATDRAITNSISTAMQSRLVHLLMKIDHEEFMKDVAFKLDWDERIIAYLHYMKDDLFDFKPDHNDKTFCCPRTWSFMNDLVKGEEVLDEDAALYAGTITSEKALQFITFTKAVQFMPKIDQIINHPTTTDVPYDRQIQFAIMIYVQRHVEEKTIASIVAYIQRFPEEFQIVFFRGLLVKQPQVRHDQRFIGIISKISRWLHD